MRRAIAAIALLLLVAAAVIWCSQAVRRAERSTGNDLVGYLAASEALYAGNDPYHLPNRFPYIYPLFLAAILGPLVPLGVRTATVLWFVLQAVCLTSILTGSRSRAREDGARMTIAIALLVAVFGDVLQSEFLNGQVNLLVVALVVAAVRLEDSHQRTAAALLGAAIALKLTPALLLAYWWIRGRYTGAGEALAWAAAFILAPWLIVQGRLWPLYATYLREFILPRSGLADAPSGAIFFSIYGFWRWITGSPSGQLTIVLLSAALLAGLMMCHWRLKRRPGVESMPAAWLYLATMPLLSPMSEVHHLVALLPIASFASQSLPGSMRLWTRIVPALFALFVVLIWIGRFDRTGPWYFLSIVALVAAGALALRYSATPPPSATRA